MTRDNYIEKLSETIELIPKEKRYIAEELIDELAFMREQLDIIKENLSEIGATDVFVNGSQTNTRVTPEFKTYLDLSNRYKQYMNELISLYPKEELNQTEADPKAQLLAQFMSGD